MNAVKEVDGRTLTVSYKGGEKKLAVPESSPWGQDTKVHFLPLSRERMGNLSGQN
jgi:hypothetical protein